jgi:hypothetical protein
MKRQISNRLVVAAMIVALLPSFVEAGHPENAQSTAQVAPSGSADRFVGVWKLRVEKASPAGTFSQLITIETQGKEYKFTCDQSVGNGTEDHWWCVTNMKGEIVKPLRTNGQPMPGKPHVTRIDSGSFKVESEIQKDIYKVSSDGQTMKLRRTYSAQTRPNVLHDASLVFDRQK